MSDVCENISLDDITKVRYEIECLSNDIKFLIPSLITKIEYNKTFITTNLLDLTDDKLKDFLKETKSFVSHLESYCKSL